MSESLPDRLGELLAQVDRSATPQFNPPPRFLNADFTGYRPTHPSQQAAVNQLLRLVAELQATSPRRGLFGLLPGRPQEGRGLYLDGGFGVGKTHLLAATFHAAPVRQKAYLSFQELVHYVGVRGIRAATDGFRGLRLLLLDEFELDDPGNTLIVKKVLESLFEQGTMVVTTSNTPAGAQGEGRFNAGDFRREIQGIAARFESLRLDGPDYRVRSQAGFRPSLPTRPLATAAGPRPATELSLAELIQLLRELHPASYSNLLDQIGSLDLYGVTTISNQNDALRFVHFIDRLYDRQVTLQLSVSPELGEDPRRLFHDTYRDGAYQKKHDRCISRLLELTAEADRAGTDPLSSPQAVMSVA